MTPPRVLKLLNYGITKFLSLRCFLPVFVQNLVHLLRGEVFMEIVVDLCGRGPAAGTDALDFFQGEHAVGVVCLLPTPNFFAQ